MERVNDMQYKQNQINNTSNEEKKTKNIISCKLLTILLYYRKNKKELNLKRKQHKKII